MAKKNKRKNNNQQQKSQIVAKQNENNITDPEKTDTIDVQADKVSENNTIDVADTEIPEVFEEITEVQALPVNNAFAYVSGANSDMPSIGGDMSATTDNGFSAYNNSSADNTADKAEIPDISVSKPADIVKPSDNKQTADMADLFGLGLMAQSDNTNVGNKNKQADISDLSGQSLLTDSDKETAVTNSDSASVGISDTPVQQTEQLKSENKLPAEAAGLFAMNNLSADDELSSDANDIPGLSETVSEPVFEPITETSATGAELPGQQVADNTEIKTEEAPSYFAPVPMGEEKTDAADGGFSKEEAASLIGAVQNITRPRTAAEAKAYYANWRPSEAKPQEATADESVTEENDDRKKKIFYIILAILAIIALIICIVMMANNKREYNNGNGTTTSSQSTTPESSDGALNPGDNTTTIPTSSENITATPAPSDKPQQSDKPESSTSKIDKPESSTSKTEASSKPANSSSTTSSTKPSTTPSSSSSQPQSSATTTTTPKPDVTTKTQTSTTTTAPKPETTTTTTTPKPQTTTTTTTPKPQTTTTTTTTTKPAPAPPPSAADFRLTYSVGNSWQSGNATIQSVSINVKNLTDNAIDGWKLVLTIPGLDSCNCWSGDASISGNTLTITNISWNGYIDPDGELSFECQIGTTGNFKISGATFNSKKVDIG